MPRGPKKIVSKSDKAKKDKPNAPAKLTQTSLPQTQPQPQPTHEITKTLPTKVQAKGLTTATPSNTLTKAQTQTQAKSKQEQKAPVSSSAGTTTTALKPGPTPVVAPASSGPAQTEKKKKTKKDKKKQPEQPQPQSQISTTSMEIVQPNVASPLPSSRIDNAQVVKAVSALLAFLQRPKENEKKSLFEKVQTISLVFTLNKVPEKQKIDPYKIVLPHPIYNDSTEICLVVGDKKKAEFKEKNLPNIKKLLSIDSLRKKYSSYEARDKLLISYDLFFCDSVVKLPLLQFFGKTFIKAKKYPIPITFHYKVPPANLIATTRDCTFLYISRGSCINLKIALSSHTTQQITENILQSMDKIVDKIPGNWEAINRISVKGADSIELPFYAKPEAQ